MECFRQIFQCFKAPFARSQEKVIEIGPPTNFRKEELPACFSDAESVISPSQTPTERYNLTSHPQNVDVSEQPRSDDGDRRGDNGHDRASAIHEGEDSQSCQKNEHSTLQTRLRECMKRSRWYKPHQATMPEKEVVRKDGLFVTAVEKSKDIKADEN